MVRLLTVVEQELDSRTQPLLFTNWLTFSCKNMYLESSWIILRSIYSVDSEHIVKIITVIQICSVIFWFHYFYNISTCCKITDICYITLVFYKCQCTHLKINHFYLLILQGQNERMVSMARKGNLNNIFSHNLFS